MHSDDTKRLFGKLDRIFNLTAEEKNALAKGFTQIRDYSTREDIIRSGERPWASKLLIDGIVCRYREFEGGRRQILAFQYPGDIFDAYSFVLETMDHSICALMPSRVAFIPHENVHEITERHPRVARALWKDTLIDAAVFAEWMTNIRAKHPSAQIAHLICEVFVRQDVVDLIESDSLLWPMTDKDIGDALGLSIDYVRSTLDVFRASGLITILSGRLAVHRLADLQALAAFDSAYLHLERPKGPAGSLDWVKPL